ncbi:L-type lectin-domain containing receptor kinase VII.1-like [Magnolia sinica]|uniref:L-type lectin-domain containing receptor kinase VII.1-like n=1 Tax=Magnolia sinica TaxID=86752 RepID=UPI00265ADD61|nr:L-type lectin-domain containing receptor kinase VII.1-like [Magnolia sinica]
MTNLPFILLLLLLLHSSSAVDFHFNGFESSNLSLYGNATLQSRILSLTNDGAFDTGRALYKTKIPAKSPNYPYLPLPFSTSFIFSISRLKGVLPGHGLFFLFAPAPGINGTSSAQNLGLFNATNDGDPQNHVFAVEFDLFQNPEFQDIDANHVGVDVNSLTSNYSHSAGFWPSDSGDDAFVNLTLNNGHNYQVWIDYADFHLNVTMAPAGTRKPHRPLISGPLNLSDVFLDEMYVGFGAATGQLVQSHRILAWSFSNSNFSAYEALITSNLPSFIPKSDSIIKSKGFIAGVLVGTIVLTGSAFTIALFWLRRLRQRRERGREDMEEWELEYWPHRMRYKEILSATDEFSEANVIGIGGNGKVYKGTLAGGIEIAVKCISHNNNEGMKEFLAEVSSLGRLKHRNLVGLRGWCKRENNSLMLVYDFMENGSLDKRIFDCGEESLLGWETRVRVLKDIGNGILYLHEGWEARVLHRDIKASNVMLDGEMNGRLGDFGLARMHGHAQALSTTRVVGTVGYMAPEVVKSGKASEKTDVFGFGVLILEAICGRRPVEVGKPELIEWVWGLMEQGKLVQAIDLRLNLNGGVDTEEAERLLQLGLLCTYSDPRARPTMRQAMKLLDGGLDVDDTEGEGMDAYLLSKLEPKNWSKYRRWSVRRSHPTFEEVQRSMSTSTSLSGSDIIKEGR